MAIQYQKQNGGFTLVEMLVSISLFTVVVTMSVGTLLILIDANGRAQSMQVVMTNLTFALDSMTREMRTGYNWYCMNAGASEPTVPDRPDLQDCPDGSPGEALSIVESGSSLTDELSCYDLANDTCTHRVTYWFDPDGHGSGHGALKRRLGNDSDDPNNDWVTLTGPEVWIDEVRFYVNGTDRLLPPTGTGNLEQPRATIYISGRAGVDPSNPERIQERRFTLETTITQRLLDI